MAIIDKNGNYMALPMSIKRGNPIPLDPTSVWYSLTELQEYAKNNATSFVGQFLSLVNEEEGTVEAYQIQNTSGDLVKLAATTSTGDLASDLNKLVGRVSNLETLVGDEESGLVKDVAVLKGTGEGSVQKIAESAADARVNKFATDISSDNVVNTFKELVDYVADHAPEAAQMAADILANQTAISGLEGRVSSNETILGGLGKLATKDSVAESDLSTDLLAIINAKADQSAVNTSIQEVKTLIQSVQDSTHTHENKSVLDLLTQDQIDQWNLAQANIIEAIQLNGVDLAIEDKKVNIPLASADSLGVVKVDNATIESKDGVLSVKAVGVSSLYVEEGTELILNGGNA